MSKYKLSAKFTKKFGTYILDEREGNAYEQGFALHSYLHPKILEKIFAEYVKRAIPAVISLPQLDGAYPSIWGVERMPYNRKVLAIYKKFKNQIAMDME